MKYNNLRQCMNLAEVICESSGMSIADADVCLITQQRVAVKFDFQGAVVEIAIAPKGAPNERN